MKRYIVRQRGEYRGWVVSGGRWRWVESAGDRAYSVWLRARWAWRGVIERQRALDELSRVLLVAGLVLLAFWLLLWAFGGSVQQQPVQLQPARVTRAAVVAPPAHWEDDILRYEAWLDRVAGAQW